MVKRVKHHRKRTANQIAHTTFMSKALKAIRAANPGVKQTDVMRMASQQYRLSKGSGCRYVV